MDQFAKPYWIRAGWLVDGSGGPIQTRVGMKIGEGKIGRIIPEPVPDQVKILSGARDLTDCTLIPGLVDCHLHLCLPHPPADLEPVADLFFDAPNRLIADRLTSCFKSGILAVRDAGDRRGATLRFKQQFLKWLQIPVRLKAAGTAWHRAGRYGKLFGRPAAEGSTLDQALATTNAGADHVKIVNSGINSLTRFGRQTAAQFDLQQLKSAFRQARQAGQKVMVHANGRKPVALALEAGCDSIEHGFFMGRDNLQQMADRQIVWVPTIGTMQALAEVLAPDGPQVAVVRRNLAHQLAQISLAKAMGVPVAVGTDAGSPGVVHGEGIIAELKLLMAAGFSSSEAIRCSAIIGGELLGLDQSGELKPGNPANFVAVEGEPAQFPESLRRIRAIFIAGQPVFVRKGTVAGRPLSESEVAFNS